MTVVLSASTNFRKRRSMIKRRSSNYNRKLSRKNSDELKDFKVTVQTEMKSYSSVLKNSCSTAHTRKAIEAAVKSVCDQEDRSKNVIIYELEETSGEVLLY